MLKYKILKPNKDFWFLELNKLIKGSRRKKSVMVKSLGGVKFGFFKYESYNCSEACSEKLAYEIAKILKKECARIEFAIDENKELGIISYFFVDSQSKQTDAKDFFNKSEFDRKKFLTINSIKTFLDKYDKNGFDKFIGMMVFDALIGETDRHEENWGLLKKDGQYTFSPLYDNSCNLLRELKNKEFMQKFCKNKSDNSFNLKDFEKYIQKSKTFIYKEGTNNRYKHMELIEELYSVYPQIVYKELKNLRKLTNRKICKVLNRLPNGIIEAEHKKYIAIYLRKRRDILLEILKG